ncbi:MAG: hypothetical protein ACE5NN_05520 [Candidatus Bathyarchaeia archaeon]
MRYCRKVERMVLLEKGECLNRNCPYRGSDGCLEKLEAAED